jgi:hypothetical protein
MLTYNTRSVGRIAVVLKEFFIKPVQINNLGKVMKCLPNGLVKPKGKDGNMERTTCTSRQS